MRLTVSKIPLPQLLIADRRSFLMSLTAQHKGEIIAKFRRAAGDTHHRALRALANRLVGVLHGCLRHVVPYDEDTAWAHRAEEAA